MGRDKATMLLDGKPLIAHVFDAAKNVFADIMVVSSLHTVFDGVKAPVIKDVLPVSGALTGIVSALIASDTEYVFVLGCDMPFVTAEAMRYVVDAAAGEDIIMPRTEAGLEPMHALYHRSCISPMLTAIGRGSMKIAGLVRGRMKIADVFAMVQVKVLSPDPVFFNRGVSVFTNINTEEDLLRAEGLVRRGGDQGDAGSGPRRGARD
jgi:molybdopterin-guanine dinucleotide biosynthesis protein A